MRKYLIGAICLSVFSYFSFGQTIQLIDESNQPIDGVFIYHELREFTAFTNDKGVADISLFPISGYYFFQHVSFNDVAVSADSLKHLNFKLVLTGKTVWFNDVVVAANKWEQDEKELSQAITSVNRKEIAFNNPATSADLLAQSGQVFIQKSQLGGGSPKLRGFSANSVLLVVDGVRMNNAIYRSGNLQNVVSIDPNTLSSSEIVFGPGSVIYGSDALGGVMDFHTIDPSWFSEGTKINGSALTRYSSSSNEKTAHFNLAIKNKNWVYFGGVTRSGFDDLKSGTNRSKNYKGYFFRPNYSKRINGKDVLVENNDPNLQVGSGYDLLNTIQKMKLRIGQRSDLTYGFYYSTTSDIPRYDRLSITQNGIDSLKNSEWNYGPQTWEMHSLRFNNYSSTKFYDQSRVTLALQDYEESRIDRDFGSNRRRTRTENLKLYSVNLDLDKTIENGHFFYGVEYAFNDVTSSGLVKDIQTGSIWSTSTRYPNNGSTYRTAAIYGNLMKKLNPKWTFNIGSRYSHVRLIADTNSENASLSDFDHIDLKNEAINGMVGLIYLPAEHTKVSLTISSGFRAPNVDDVGKIFEFDNDENGQQLIVIPNPNLKPEYSYNQEVSYTRKFEKITVSTVVFNTILTKPIIRGSYLLNGSNDVIVGNTRYNIRAQINGKRSHIYGASAQLKVDVSPTIQAYGTASFSNGKEQSTGEPLRHTTPVFGKIGVKVKESKWETQLYVDFNGPRWKESIPSTEIDDKPYLYTGDGSPEWYTINLKSNYQASSFLSVTGGIENIFDTHYRPYSSGISAPGRNFIISLRGSF